MNIRLFRNSFVPIWISTPELHVYDTFYLHEYFLGSDTYIIRITYMYMR